MPQRLVNFAVELTNPGSNKHPKCKGYFDNLSGEFDCGYNTTIDCEYCKYGIGRKDPEAKCNQYRGD